MTISINPKKIFQTLFGVTLCIALVHLISQYLIWHYSLGAEATRALNTFNMDNEISIPTWYNQTLLLVVGFLAAAIGLAKRKMSESKYGYWLGLGFIFTYLSIDEGASIHEQFGTLTRNLGMDFSGTIFHFDWLIVGILLVAIFALLYFKFWLALPPKTRTLFFVSALIYIGGAVGVEMIGGYYSANFDRDFTYSLLVMAEEFMEKMGLVVFIYSLLDYMESNIPKLALKVSSNH